MDDLWYEDYSHSAIVDADLVLEDSDVVLELLEAVVLRAREKLLNSIEALAPLAVFWFESLDWSGLSARIWIEMVMPMPG